MRSIAPILSAPTSRVALPAWFDRVSAVIPWVAPFLVIGLIIVRRWVQLGAFITGMDPGEWFALGRGYFGGDGRSTTGAYPPLIPVVMQLFRQVANPIDVAKAVAVLSVGIILVAAFLAAREGMELWFALGVAATIGLSGTLSEAITFGGYPQNTALMFMILAALGLTRYLATGQRREGIWAAAALAGAAVSHHTYFPVACAVFAAVWVLWLTTRPTRIAIRQRTIGTVVAGVIGVLAFLPTAIAFRVAGYDPPVNSNNFNYTDAIGISIREARWIWWPVFVVGTLAFPLLYRRRGNAAWQVGGAMTAVAIVLFLVTKEPRLLPPLVVGTAIGVGLGLEQLWRWTWQQAWGAIPLILAALIPMLLWPYADARAAELVQYYRVMDPSMRAAIRFVDDTNPTGTVVVHKSQKGWPVGWWFEGLTDEKIAVGSDERWLGFAGERDNARLAAHLFDAKTTPQDAVKAARRRGVELLVFRESDWSGWQTWLLDPTLSVKKVYDDGETMILDVTP